MSRNLIQSAILQRPWLIQPEFAYANTGIIQKILKGEPVSYHDDREDSDEEKLSVGCFVISPAGDMIMGSRSNPFENAVPGSTAVIGITGAIMKYDNCGDPGTKSYAALLTKARKNTNITSAVLVIDSPGGTVDGTQELAAQIKAFDKPIVALTDGMMCSAAYWLGSQTDEIIANNETATIGSIGTMLSFMDVYSYWEKKGVKFHWVYADASTDKNKGFHDLLKGNDATVKAELNKINDIFLAAVKAGRPNIKETALTGKTFMAEEALAQGLIDSIGSFEVAVERAQALAGIKPGAQPNKQSQKSNMKTITLLASHAALLALSGATIEAGKNSVDVEAKDELMGNINSALEAGTKAAADLKAAQDVIASLEAAAVTAAEALTAANAATEKVTGEFEAFKKGTDGATGSASKAAGDKIDADAGAHDYTTEEDQKLAASRAKIYGS